MRGHGLTHGGRNALDVVVSFGDHRGPCDVGPDPRACPACGSLGEPQHDVDGVTLYACTNLPECGQDETWEVFREDVSDTDD